ncbi:MAG: DNA primase, partial [Firmicutes bacterium]|nr:DNA primase [Bacillota bacterium]
MTDLTDFIQQVKRSNDIVDVVGSYLELRQKGTTHWARCPFHGEKTASFSVNRNLQIYKCFGCGVSGDVVKFVQEYESLTFLEALEKLAKRANLKMPEMSRQRQDKDYAERKKKQDVYMDICRDAAVFYYKNYYAERGKIARDYVESRRFSSDTVKKFGIGYSPDQYSLVSYLREKKYSIEDAVACGVLQRKGGNGEPFDALSRRLIIPIFNMQGKVIAFGGRGITDDEINFGKYKNTSETPIFSKKDNLFAINIAKEQKQQAALPNIVVVEGYMDVIAMYQAGFKRAVASMGTSLTESQAKWLSRLTST